MMLSSTLMPLKRATFWKVRAMPSAATSGGREAGAVPALEDGCGPRRGGRSR